MSSQTRSSSIKKKPWTISDLIKSCDYYRVLPKEMTEPTITGATVTLIAMTILMLMLVTEFAKYLQVKHTAEMALIDPKTFTNSKINVSMEIDFFSCPCELLTMQINDIMGTSLENIFMIDEYNDKIEKYGINQFQEVMYQHKEEKDLDITRVIENLNNKYGCKLIGIFEINKVPGYFRITSSSPKPEIQEALVANGYNIDFTHRILKLSFNQETEAIKTMKDRIKGRNWAPLEGTIAMHPTFIGTMQLGYQSSYYMDITPVTFVETDLQRHYYLHYSASHQNMLTPTYNNIFFRFELSPLSVVFTFQQTSLLKFLISLCAIIGGFFTVFSIIESLLRNAAAYLQGQKQSIK